MGYWFIYLKKNTKDTMDTVMDYGIAKTQKLPYSYWGQLRGIETRQELADFLYLFSSLAEV